MIHKHLQHISSFDPLNSGNNKKYLSNLLFFLSWSHLQNKTFINAVYFSAEALNRQKISRYVRKKIKYTLSVK